MALSGLNSFIFLGLGTNRSGSEQLGGRNFPVFCYQLLHVSHYGAGKHGREDSGW